ncbi:MAG: MFS transporter [Bacteroidales bacterium]|nr:MFS transporter [Bacteroidales bacterium]MDT8430098.1 MFS transporter [Bacteroidales bacterium]
MKDKGTQPFDPSKLPVFYGWIILAAGTLGMLMSGPGQTVGVSAFTEYLLKDLQIDRDNLSLAYLFGTLGSGLMITRAGKLYDRYGARIMAFIAGVMLGIMLLYLTRVDVIVAGIGGAGFFSPVLVTFLLLAVGFWGIRFFGQGMLTMVSRNMVMKWFDKRRGMANAVLGIFTAFGFSLAPRIFSLIIDKLEWRGAWEALALAVGVIFAVFVLLIFRDNPAGCGLQPDGRLSARQQRKRPPSLPDHDFTLKEARSTLAFWAFTLALALSSLYVTGLTFHVVSIFEDGGMDEVRALGIFLPTSFIAMSIQFGFSYLSDFVKLKYLLILFVAGMLISATGLLILGDTGPGYMLLIGGNGIVWGLYAVLIGVTWPRFFGLKHLGAISGFSLSWTVIGSALGPYLFSLSYKYFDGYGPVAWLCLGIETLLFLLSFKAENPGSPG